MIAENAEDKQLMRLLKSPGKGKSLPSWDFNQTE